VRQAPQILAPQLAADHERSEQLVRELHLDRSKPAIGLMPGAEYGPAKQWPAEYYGALAKQLATDGAQCWIFGSAKEVALGERIREISGGAALNLCGKTSLADLVDLSARCRAVVTNDSGPMHIAAAA